MPRPTAAQFSYGTVTVVFSTLAMLLMSRTSSGIAVAVIGTAALVLGLLVAVTVPLPKSSKATPATARAYGTVEDVAGIDGFDGIGPKAPAGSADRSADRVIERISEHSLRR